MEKTTVFYEDNELELCVDGLDILVSVQASATWYHEPDVFYLRNGDPGYPGADEIEDIEYDIQQCGYFNEDDLWVPVEITSRIEYAIEEYLYDMDFDEWS